MANADTGFDEIGYWSEIKIDIIREYASAYTTILNSKPYIKGYIYIDAFAGAGIHKSKTTGEDISGTPLEALKVKHAFHEYHFIDLNKRKTESLHRIAQGRENVFIYEADCNNILLNNIFPRARWNDFRRALCILDPYGLNLEWKIIETAGQMKSIDIFLNFPVMDMNRNVLWDNPDKVTPNNIERMNSFWGDDSWKNIAYRKNLDLFGETTFTPQRKNLVVKNFQNRLKEKAGWEYVPEPIPMRNSTGSIVYYLFFASHQRLAHKIITDIFNKYKNWGVK